MSTAWNLSCLMTDAEKLTLSFGELTTAYRPPNAFHEILFGIEAPLEIAIAGQVYFREPCFSVVELSAQLKGWIASDEVGFRFLSIDHDEPLLCLAPAGETGLTISSPWEEFSPSTPLDRNAARSELERFAAEVIDRCTTELGVDPTSAIEEYLSL